MSSLFGLASISQARDSWILYHQPPVKNNVREKSSVIAVSVKLEEFQLTVCEDCHPKRIVIVE